jgi:2-oxoglutarate ferredoxin oxidoreductase subunit gamma
MPTVKTGVYEGIIIAGFGGQGILSIGKIIAQAGMEIGLNVTWLPSYGPEIRGGTAYSHVILSDKPVGSPLLNSATAFIAMNRPSFEKYVKLVIDGGLAIVDGSLVDLDAVDAAAMETARMKGLRLFSLPATKTALDNGNSTFANIILAGKLIKEIGALTVEAFEAALYKSLSEKYQGLIPKEMEMLRFGMNY